MSLQKPITVLSLFDGISCGQLALERANIPYDSYYASEINPHTIKVTMQHYPQTIQLGDITTVKAENLPKIYLLMGGSPCFTAGTEIICERGVIPIEDVKVGERVLSHKGIYRNVTQIGGQQSETYLLQSQSGTITETTANHPYYIRRRNKVGDNDKRKHGYVFSDPAFVKVSDLTKSHYLGTPILKSRHNPENLTEDECFIIGLYIGDGHTRKDPRVAENRALILSVGEHKQNELASQIHLPYSSYKHNKSVVRFVFHNKRLVEYVERNCGISVSTKHFGKEIIDLPKNLLQKVIEGYLFTDGSFNKGTYRATTVSRRLVESLTLAVAKAYETTTCIEYADTWTISFKKKQPKQSRAWVIDGYIWNPIKMVKATGEKKQVYNLEVETDNSYIANNHAVHNCQGFSFAGKQLNFQDPRSKLFFDFVRLLNECKPTYFLLENVPMKLEYQDVISKYLGVEPVMINSNLVSAQNRRRLYWTNIPIHTQPEDKGILLKDIVHEHEPIDTVLTGSYAEWFAKNGTFQLKKKYCALSPDKALTMTGRQYASWNGNYWFEALQQFIVPFDTTLKILDKEVARGKVGYFRKDSQANRVYYIHDKAITLTGEAGGGAAKMGQYLFGCITPERIEKRQNGQRFNDGKKFYTLTAQDKHGILIEGYIRKLTPIECERLQTLPDNFTDAISTTQRYKALGNGWTVDIIAHILQGINIK